MNPKTLGALTATGLAVSIAAASAAAVPSFSSGVTMRQTEPAKFKGRVFSDSDFCRVGRKVRIIRALPGKDQRVTKSFADEAGKWRVFIPMQSGQRLYSKVRAETVPPGGVTRASCGGDRSKAITVSG